MADSESILQLGIEAARAGDKAEARDLFRLVTREDPNNAQGWLWLAGVAEDREEKRAALERVIQIDPKNELARKGLAALSARTTNTLPVAAPPPTTPPASEQTPPPPVNSPAATSTRPAAPPATTGVDAPADLELADALDSTDIDEADDGGAKTYTRPVTAAAAGAAAGNWSAPDFGDDAYDLSDYQNRPGLSAADVDATEPEEGGTVVVEDDEPPRGSLPAWLVPLIGVLAVVLIGGFLFQRCSSSTGSVATAPTRTPISGPTTDTGSIGGSVSSEPTTGSDTLPPSLTPGRSSQTAVSGQTTIVIEGSGTMASGTQTAAGAGTNSTSVAQAQPSQVNPTPNQTASAPAGTVTAPTNPPAANGDVSSANPQPVPPQQRIVANAWNFVWNYGFGQLKTVGTSAYGGARPTHGQWLAITIAAANTSGQPTKIPDGLFVLKDAQNRVYPFNRAASVDWFNRFGGRGVIADISADDPFTTDSASTILLFDVPPDASNLVLFNRENVNQGYMIR